MMKTFSTLATMCLLIIVAVTSAFAQIGVIVNKNLYPYIQPAVNRYVQDLIDTGETVLIDTTTFAAGNSRSELQALRSFLRDWYHQEDLTGAVLIGELPRADYERIATKSDGSCFVEMTYPIDYYFMNLNDATDANWKDDHPDGDDGVFDGYSGDKVMEIWVSRIIAHNFQHETDWITIGKPKQGGKYEYGDEVDILNDYFFRLHERMTQPAKVPRRGLSVGDYKNWFNEANTGLQHLGVPYITLKFPHDTPDIWMRELRQGQEMAAIFEHSSPTCHNFAQDQGENSNGHLTSFWIGDEAKDRSFLDMPVDGGPSRVPFYNSLGCSSLEYNQDNCLGQMYAMLHSGLVSMGATSLNWGNNSHDPFAEELANGSSFGEAYKAFVNKRGSWSYDRLVLALLGAGTLKLEPYVPNPAPQLVIEQVWAQKDEFGPFAGPYLHGDLLTLHAEVTSDPPGYFDPAQAVFSWHGLQDVAWGNPADFVLEGHNLPLASNGGEGEYFITLHVEQPNCQPASAVVDLRGWRFKKFGNIFYFDPGTNNFKAHLNRHRLDGSEVEVRIRGLTQDIGGTNDDFIYYYTDIISGDFEVMARVKDWRNSGTASYDDDAKAGVMIRLGTGTNAANVFMGVTYAKGAVFQYRQAPGESTQQKYHPGYTAGNSWVKLRRTGQYVYGYGSHDGSNFDLLGSMMIGPTAQPYVGFAYACNDDALWPWTYTDFSHERGVQFADMQVKKLSEPLPIEPVVEYVNQVDGTITAYFGYNNPNDYTVILEAGADNNFGYQGQGILPQPITEFKPGRVLGAIGIEYDGSALTWNLSGRSASTEGASAKNLRLTPYVESVVNNCDGTYTVQWGYDSSHDFAIVKEVGPFNKFEYGGEGYFYYNNPMRHFEPGRIHNAQSVEFGKGELIWHLDGNSATAHSSMAQNVCPDFKFYRAFAFGADGWTREVPNAPGQRYIKIVQNGNNFLYDPERGYGYSDVGAIDPTDKNRNILSGPDEIYDQFIGVKNLEYGYRSITFRVDAPPGIYRFVAAGGDARYGGHRTTIEVYPGYYYGGITLVEDQELPANTYYRVGFDDKIPPVGDGLGKQPQFLAIEESPYLRLAGSDNFINIRQLAPGDEGVDGGDLCLLEIWYIPLVEPLQSLTEGEPKGAFGDGYQTDEVTEPDNWRWAEHFYGFDGIDSIAWTDTGPPCYELHNYVIGQHQGDVAEYLMTFGGEFNRLILRGMADIPGPVELDIYIDGQYKATAFWDDANNCNQDVAVDIHGIAYGTHAVAVEFANDRWEPNGDPDQDRNLYLDALMAAVSDALPTITHGKPRGTFQSGRQTDQVTAPGRWRRAELFYGFKGIDGIGVDNDACGNPYTYAVGLHQDDLIEYLMKMGEAYRYLILRGKADRPGPVTAEIFIDGKYHETVLWDRDSDANQDVVVPLDWSLSFGTHAVAIKFIDDYSDPNTGEDRNLYLNSLLVSKVEPVRIISDNTWKSFDKWQQGWESLSFDDKNWRHSYAPYPNPGSPQDWFCGTDALYRWDYKGPLTPNGQDGPAEAWFRRTFRLNADPKDLAGAIVKLAADDDFDFYVNGKRVFSDWNGTLAGAPFTVDIRPYLVRGNNVFAIHAQDTYGLWEWMLFDANIGCPETEENRTTDGLVALYTFRAGTGRTVFDVAPLSSADTPLDLWIDPATTHWIEGGGLAVDSPTLIMSAAPAAKIIEACRQSNEITVEAWIRPDDTEQDGPARIVTLSKDLTNRNFTLGQGRWGDQPKNLYDVRLRTKRTTATRPKLVSNGRPSLSSPVGSLSGALQHVVYTRDQAGNARIYIDGFKVAATTVDGDFSNWDNGMPLALASELTGDRPWLGEYYLVAIYSRALNASEVRQNFMASEALPNTDARVAHYTFEEGYDSATVYDEEDFGGPLDLTIADPQAVLWIDGGGLTITSDNLVASDGPAKKVIYWCRQNNAITIEAWVAPITNELYGPARIVTLSENPYSRNLTLGQGLWGSQPRDLYDVRLRTTTTGLNGMPSLSSPAGSLTAALTHVVYTYDSYGEARIYINGQQVASKHVGGDLSNWDEAMRLGLGNEITRDRPWLGTFYRLDIYSRILSPMEVRNNFAAGP